MNFCLWKWGRRHRILPYQNKMCKYELQEFFWEKLNTKSIFWSSASKPQGKSLKKKGKIIKITLKNDRYLDVQNINKKIMNLALLFIVSWNSKDESHGIIKLLSIIIPIFIQQIKLYFNQKTKVDKKLFLFKTIILSCEEVDISKRRRNLN